MVPSIGDRVREYRSHERAVSPVIGVILMVAITVILAAVIGAFVMGIGGEQASAPNANLEVSQDTYSVATSVTKGGTWFEGNTHIQEDVRHFRVRHGGGEALNQENIQLQANLAFEPYVDGSITEQVGWLVGLNQSRDAPAQISHSGDRGGIDYTTGKWNNIGERTIEAPETSRYSWWINDDEDVVDVPDDSQLGFDPVTFRDVYQDSTSRCGVEWLGSPRQGYVDGSGEILGTGGDNIIQAFYLNDASTESYKEDYGEAINNCPIQGNNDMRIHTDEHWKLKIAGEIEVGDVGRVIWSPPDADQSSVLAEYELR